ncbi:MAG: hypothetical protein RJA57_382 [Bacteroidota bacterium]|jgi:hypothetical protein
MKKWILTSLIIASMLVSADAQIGVKAGLNFVNVTSPAGINADSRSGYMIGGFFSPRGKKMFGFRSEFLLSRQGYDFKTGTNTGSVDLDYLLLPQLFVIRFTKKVEVHAGGQLAFLLNARSDSTGSRSLLDYFSRFDYGLAGGVQVSPILGLFVGARINVSLTSMRNESPPSPLPSFIPRADVRNNVVQFYAGWQF